MYDDFGNEYKADNAKLSNSQHRGYVKKRLVANIPTKGSIRFSNISTQATKITLLEFYVIGEDLAETKIQYRNISFK